MLLLEGCVQQAATPLTNGAARRVLDRLGIRYGDSLPRTKNIAAVAAILIGLPGVLASDKPDIAEETKTYSIEASLPKLRDADGLLADKLKADLMLQLDAFRASAENEKAQAEQGNYEFRAHSLTVNWQTELYTFRLLSLIRYDWTYQGGAHGNTTHETLLFDRKTRRIRNFGDLFGGSEKEVRAKLREFAVSDLLRQKAKRDGKPVEGYQDSFVEEGVKGRFLNFTLDPSDVRGRAAGLRIWYAPYAVGAYVEGSFEVFVPHPVFSKFLTSYYKDAFAGKSVRK